MLVLTYDPLVHKAVARLPGNIRSAADIDDLHSFGLFGLIDAIEKCESDSDPARFAAYALVRVRGAIIDELRKLDWIPRSTRRQLIEYRTVVDELSTELGRAPSRSEIFSSMEVSTETGLSVMLDAVSSHVASLSQPLHIGDADAGRSSHLGSIVESSEGPEEFLLLQERNGDLCAAIGRLGTRQQFVINARFVAGRTQQQIATELGVTKARVCQIEAGSIRALRAMLAITPLGSTWNEPAAS
jgi:RNA polymerase sigma factor for flagellar operon FliA